MISAVKHASTLTAAATQAAAGMRMIQSTWVISVNGPIYANNSINPYAKSGPKTKAVIHISRASNNWIFSSWCNSAPRLDSTANSPSTFRIDSAATIKT